MTYLSRRNPRIIDIRDSSRRNETLYFHDPCDIFGKQYSTGLDRNREEFAFLSEHLRQSPNQSLRVLEVGIGETFVGETVNLLSALERTHKPYELVCMDSHQGMILHHALQDEFIAEGWHYHMLDITAEALRGLISNLACVENVREIDASDHVFSSAFPGVHPLDFRFDIPQRILDSILYLLGDIARDPIPPNVLKDGFDAVVCLHTLYHIDDARALERAVQNLIRYLSANGLLAIDTGKGRLSRHFGPNLERLPNMRRVFGPHRELGGHTDAYYVFELEKSETGKRA